MLGDAAHATLPHLGQGANMALDDAWCLAQSVHDAISAGNVADGTLSVQIATGLRVYEAKRLEKTSKIVQLSKMMGLMNNADGALLCWLRDSMTGFMTSSGLFQKQMAVEINKNPVIILKGNMPK